MNLESFTPWPSFTSGAMHTKGLEVSLASSIFFTGKTGQYGGTAQSASARGCGDPEYHNAGLFEVVNVTGGRTIVPARNSLCMVTTALLKSFLATTTDILQSAAPCEIAR